MQTWQLTTSYTHRYFRINATASAGGQPYTSMQELNAGTYITLVAGSSVPPGTSSTHGPYGSFHQIVKAPAGASASGGSTPVPVASFLQGGTVGTAYSEPITAQGGTSPYTFAVTTGALPTGLAMSSSGIITGTPTAAASYSFTVTVTDANGTAGTQGFVIEIATPSTAAPSNWGWVA